MGRRVPCRGFAASVLTRVDGVVEVRTTGPVARRPEIRLTTTDPLDVLHQTFGHAAFRGRQRAVIDRVLGGGHALVLAPTGGGKSLCYQVPALCRPGVAVVLSPLIALMKDQVDALARRGVAATYVNSSLGRREREARYAGLAAGAYRLLYVTPERFRKPDFNAALDAADVSLLAVDEAHCISQWGHDFRPDYSRLAEIRERLGRPVTVALTATATPAVQADIRRQLGLTECQMPAFHEGIDRPNLTLDVEDIYDEDDKLDAVRRCAAAAGPGVIVYFALIRTLRSFSERLRAAGFPHLNYHGELDRRQRRDVQDDFTAGRAPAVLATNAFGMGIDKADVRAVVHAELPGSLESYYQEIGRAGRDGAPARCTLLYDQRDLATQMEFLRWAHPDAGFYRRTLDLIEHDGERVHAEGLEYLRRKLLDRRWRHDRRLDTALAMLERHGVLSRDSDWRDEDHVRLEVVGDLPAALTDDAALAARRRAGQEKLLALVNYAKRPDDAARKAFLNDYFGV